MNATALQLIVVLIPGLIGTVTLTPITPVAVTVPIVSTITALVVAIVTTVIASVSITTIAPMVVSIVVIYPAAYCEKWILPSSKSGMIS